MMWVGNCLNLQQVQTCGRGGGGVSNGVHVLGGGSALAGCVIVWLVADHDFHGEVQALFIKLPMETQDEVKCCVKINAYVLSPSSGLAAVSKLVSSMYWLHSPLTRWLYNLPYRHDGFPVLAVACPNGYFISFWSDIDHSSTNIFTCLIKRFTN